ncbi:acyl-CoA dehydrogenase [Actinomycetospora sp. NBRC 106375]|uniref:acyl-CoA dehydrogenase family protein n=1 Tax=Actinomycetospora sp. NBRC 106375 TaxID=3032207 RepID=UPI0024A21176|nr:acyl-CoA dehydrogenase family protein [Actinomycetospora sp. NBRC 106375]GLZ48132.1 acyl-CoA dehydrogenase [Actinomycetospora sp. NBRC 106375]
MRWELSQEQSDFRDVLAGWLTDRCGAAEVRAWLDAGDPAAFEDRFLAEGWFGVGAPEDVGGQGGGLVETVLAAEELGRVTAPTAGWLGAMAALPGLLAVPEEAKALLADGVVTVLGVPADAVPGAAPAVAADGGAVTGVIAGVLGADRARRLLVPVAGGSLVLVEADAAGVEVRPRVLTDRSRSVADVVLDGARGRSVPGDAAVALEAGALRAAVLVAADALGAAERMLDAAVSHAGQRRQFGVPIGSFQAVKHAAAEMLVTVESARSIVYLAAASLEAGHPDASAHVAAAKAQVTAGASRAADTALTLHGAIGYTWEHDLQLSYKRAKLDEHLFGAPAAWNERLAASLDLVP